MASKRSSGRRGGEGDADRGCRRWLRRLNREESTRRPIHHVAGSFFSRGGRRCAGDDDAGGTLATRGGEEAEKAEVVGRRSRSSGGLPLTNHRAGRLATASCGRAPGAFPSPAGAADAPAPASDAALLIFFFISSPAGSDGLYASTHTLLLPAWQRYLSAALQHLHRLQRLFFARRNGGAQAFFSGGPTPD